jgi:hypothetical protein
MAAVKLVTDAGGVHFDGSNSNIAFGHDVQTAIDFRHARIGSKAIALGELNLEWVVFCVFRRKIFDPEGFAIAFDLIDQLQWNVMMMNVDRTRCIFRVVSRHRRAAG